MGAQDIGIFELIIAYATLLISIGILRFLKINLFKDLVTSFSRMTIQLLLVGLYLSYIFKYNSLWLNCLYILIMMAAANHSLLKNSGLKLQLFSFTFPSLLIGIGGVLAYFTLLVFKPEPMYDAKYMIPVAGMLLGNSMNRTIVTLERFYNSIKQDNEGYVSLVTMGGSVSESIMPYFRTAYKAGIAPTLANFATIGLVSLPGMMTGQILGGSTPMVAIKYQIVILLAIYIATEISTILAVLFSLKRGFNRFGFLRHEIFKNS